ncbi:helix-turn-helix domain-containing protein [Limnohabitans sp.]|uniref:helix-turn-helix domain-containing protein n=1 Tax=Limnohabitans sp. TaxID=1907725 RepID=UPI0037C07502
MSYPMVESARQNKLLAGVPLSHYARMSEHLKPVDLTAGQVIYEAGESLEFVYFPTTCTTSLVSHTTDGDSSELAMTGRDGMVGVALVLGSGSMNHRVVVQCAGQAFRMPADAFLMEMTRCRELQQLVLCYVQILITQMSQSIVCIGHHSVSERLSYWLLFNRDALDSDQLKVTHEMIANMLGVRRESVTQALGKLQSAGLVASGRGKINILDRDGLTDCVCECFSLVSSETQRLYERAGRTPEACFESDEACLQPVGQDHDLLHKYQDAYDFAPVGFVSLDRQGRVVHTNLAGAIMLDIQRSQHKLSPFQAFMKPSDQAAFLTYHQEVFSGRCRRYCEVTLCATDHRSEMVVRIDATLDEMGEECRLVMIDVTEDKKQMAQELARERQQQEWLARQPFMLWFKDQDGHLISANSSLIEDWRHFAQDASLEKVDLQSMPVNFRGQNLQSSHSSSDELRSGAFKPS